VLANVYARAITDRWRGFAIGTFTLVAFLVLGMAAYRDIDLSLYTSMPEAFRSIVGIDVNTDAGSLAYSAMYSSYGALVLFSLALAMGAAAIAGEERRGTLGLLLANPVSRTGVLLSKAAALVTLTGAGVGLMWVGGLVVPVVLDVDTTGKDLTALVVHLLVGALFFGFLALAIGAWTGNSGLANGVAAGVMVLSFFAVGLLPLVERLADLARAFPWYYVSGGDPLSNGVNWGHLTVLAGGTVLLAAVAVLGLNRRDLKESSTRVTIGDRLRAIPATRRAMDRLAGSARVSAIWVKSASDHQGLLLVVDATMLLMMGAMIGAMYPAIDQALVTLGEVFPAELLALFGGGDMSRPEGFYQVETFGMMAPIGVMILTILIGARAVAGEEERRTMGLLLGNPVPRSRVLLEKTLVLVLFGLSVGLATFLGVAIGNILGGLGMDLVRVAATCLLVSLLGIAFGAVALLVGAATGRVRVAAWIAIGLALASHVANAFLPFSDSLAGLARWTPTYYYLGGDPLVNGLDWTHAAVLAGLAAALIAAAVPAFNRRDLRQGG
jgi:beta-exotoxin I transport system permease protein